MPVQQAAEELRSQLVACDRERQECLRRRGSGHRPRTGEILALAPEPIRSGLVVPKISEGTPRVSTGVSALFNRVVRPIRPVHVQASLGHGGARPGRWPGRDSRARRLRRHAISARSTGLNERTHGTRTCFVNVQLVHRVSVLAGGSQPTRGRDGQALTATQPACATPSRRRLGLFPTRSARDHAGRTPATP